MNLLFICAGNAIRSPMAEGWARHLANNSIGVASAGIQALGVHPLAVETMRQAGVDISHHVSRTISDELLHWADHIITLSETVKPYCAFFPESAVHHHWSILNPDTLLPGLSREESYAEIRDKIKHNVKRLLKEIAAGQSQKFQDSGK